MKNYDISFTVNISDVSKSYETVNILKVEVKERLPVNVDPELYLRSRIAEEIKRQFKNLADEIENKTEDFDALEVK